MILKGNQRGGGQQLASHLMNSFDNDRVEVAEVRGAVARDLSGAFAEWSAQARATKMRKKFYYSLSLNPDPAQGRLTREQYLDLIARTERSLNFVGQPRAIVFHEKRDEHGVPREHCHVVWSRVDLRHPDTVKAVDISHDRLKLRTVTRQFCRDHRLELPERMKPGRSRDSRRERFNIGAQENLGERQQKERTGISKSERMADIAACWQAGSNGHAFVEAMKARGYQLAQGDQRDYVVVDRLGEVHSLSRQLRGVARKPELNKRLADFPADKLPGVEATHAVVEQKRKEAVRRAVAPKARAGPSETELRRQALEQRQLERRAKLDRARVDLAVRHRDECEGLKALQSAESADIAAARLHGRPKGFMAFLIRITGIRMIAEAREKRQDKACTTEHNRHAEALRARHEREERNIERRYRALARLETRENRSVALALRREELRQFMPRHRATVRPEFELAAARTAALQKDSGGDDRSEKLKKDFAAAAKVKEAEERRGGGKGHADSFNRAAHGSGFTKGELRDAFARATSKPSAAKEQPEEVDPEIADRARKIKEELDRRQPPPRPGPDRDRER